MVDEVSDLTFLGMRVYGSFRPVALADPNSVRVGEDVMAMGCPTGNVDVDLDFQTFTQGMVSAERLSRSGIQLLQTDAAINPGMTAARLLNHLPSGRFAANAAWMAIQVMAHNLARWTARMALGVNVVTTKTLRRRLFSLAGRLTRSARRLTLHLPQHWPWETQFSRALARLRALPSPA